MPIVFDERLDLAPKLEINTMDAFADVIMTLVGKILATDSGNGRFVHGKINGMNFQLKNSRI